MAYNKGELLYLEAKLPCGLQYNGLVEIYFLINYPLQSMDNLPDEIG